MIFVIPSLEAETQENMTEGKSRTDDRQQEKNDRKHTNNYW